MHIIQLAKFLEQLLLIFLAYANARVLHFDENLLLLTEVRGIYLDKTVVLRKLQCILDQVDEHLLKTRLVSIDSFWEVVCQVVDQLGTLVLCCDLEHAVYFMNELVHAEVSLFESKAALFNPSQVQQVIDEVVEQAHLEVDMCDEIFEIVNACDGLVLINVAFRLA